MSESVVTSTLSRGIPLPWLSRRMVATAGVQLRLLVTANADRVYAVAAVASGLLISSFLAEKLFLSGGF